MIKGNRRQKLRLLTEWMDYFILEHKEEIKRSLKQEEIVFIQNQLDEKDYDVAFGLMVFENFEMDLAINLSMKTGKDKGQCFWFEIQKRDNQSKVWFNGNTENEELVHYPLETFMRYMSHQALTHLLSWILEAQEVKKISCFYKGEVEAVIQDALINYYLDRGQFEALKQMFPKGAEQTGSQID
jgi:hypothetical protein